MDGFPGDLVQAADRIREIELAIVECRKLQHIIRADLRNWKEYERWLRAKLKEAQADFAVVVRVEEVLKAVDGDIL